MQAGPSGRIGGTPGEQVVVAADGRVRRRAVFGEDALPAGAGGMAAGSGSGSDDDEEEEGSEEEEEDSSSGEEDEEDEAWQQRQQRGAAGPSAGSDEEEEEGMGAAAAWKARMLERASALFRCAGRPLPAVAGSRVHVTNLLSCAYVS